MVVRRLVTTCVFRVKFVYNIMHVVLPRGPIMWSYMYHVVPSRGPITWSYHVVLSRGPTTSMFI